MHEKIQFLHIIDVCSKAITAKNVWMALSTKYNIFMDKKFLSVHSCNGYINGYIIFIQVFSTEDRAKFATTN